MNTKVTNYRAIFKILGIIMIIVGAAEVFPWIYAEVTGDVEVASAFRICAFLSTELGLAMFFFVRTGRPRCGA